MPPSPASNELVVFGDPSRRVWATLLALAAAAGSIALPSGCSSAEGTSAPLVSTPDEADAYTPPAVPGPASPEPVRVRIAEARAEIPTCDLGKPPSKDTPPVTYKFTVTDDMDAGAAATGGNPVGTFVAKKISFLYPSPIAALLNVGKSSLDGHGWARLSADGSAAMNVALDLELDTNIIGKASFDSSILFTGKYRTDGGDLHLDIACPDPKTLPIDFANALRFSTNTDGVALRVFLTQTPAAVHYPVTLVVDFDAVPEN
jgi:hypothetical protein